MMDGRAWRILLGRYGQRITLLRGEEEAPVRAFFQPVGEKAPGQEPTPLGVTPRGCYLYLGPAEETLEDVEELIWEGRSFCILRHRGFPVGDGMVYRWAMCQELDERAGVRA